MKKAKLKCHKCQCIYCGKEFYSSKVNAKYDRNSCRIIYFKEKKAFNAAYEHEAMALLYGAILPFSKKLLKKIKEIADGKPDASDIDKITRIVQEGTEYVKARAIKGDLFDLYIRERLEKTGLN